MWLRICCILLGIWLLVSPAILGASSTVAAVDRLAGPVAVAIGVLSLRAVTRVTRMANVATGLFLLVTIPAMHGASTLEFVNNEVVGWLLIALSIPRGAVRQRTDGGWRAIVRPDPERYNDDALASNSER